MSSLPGERTMLPARVELRAASPWVWALLGVAAIAFLAVMLSDVQFGVDTLSRAALSAAPAVVAAALMFAAPRERLIQLAAFGFVVPVVVITTRLVVTSDVVVPDTTISDYALLIPRLVQWTDTLSSVTWAFTAVAFGALAMHIGRIKTAQGWAIVGVAVLIATARVVNVLTSWPPLVDPDFAAVGLPLDQLLFPFLSILTTIAVGYFLAAAFEGRLWLLAIGAAARLLGSALAFVPLGDVATPADPMPLGLQLFLGLSWVLAVISWTALIAGVLLELPRHGHSTATDPYSTTSPEALSLSR